MPPKDSSRPPKHITSLAIKITSQVSTTINLAPSRIYKYFMSRLNLEYPKCTLQVGVLERFI